MKKIVTGLFLSIFCFSLFAGGQSEADAAGLKGTVATNGSTSMQKVIISLVESFKEKAPGVNITYDPTGSGAGVEAAATGKADIGLASRDLKDKEVAQGLKSTVLALDGIAIVVHKDNKIDNLTAKQLADIFTGKITNWKELGGNNLKISCVGRESVSGTRDAFESVTKTKGNNKLESELTSTGTVISTVASNPNAIGYASVSAVEGQTGIKVLKIDGVAPSVATILDKTYSLQRPFNLVTKEGVKFSPAAQAFFDYITSGSEEVNKIITNAGAIPLK